MIDIAYIDTDQIKIDRVISKIEETDLVEQHYYIKHCFEETKRNATTMLGNYYMSSHKIPRITEIDINYPLRHLANILEIKMRKGINGIRPYDPKNQFENTYNEAIRKYNSEVANSKSLFPSGKGSISLRNKYLRPIAREFLEEVIRIAAIGEALFE